MVGVGIPGADSGAPLSSADLESFAPLAPPAVPDFGVDLPAPAVPRAKIAAPIPSGVDLPARKVASGVDLPAPAVPRPKIAPPMPSGMGQAARPPSSGVDLPAPAVPRPKIAPPMPSGMGQAARPPSSGVDLPAPAAPRPKIAPPMPSGVDLPAPAARKPSSDDFGLDLPAPKGSGVGLPAPALRKSAAGDFGVDLPAPAARKPSSDDFGLDLPAPAARKPSSDDFGLDLPAPALRKPSSDDFGLDLPAPKGSGADLPAPATRKPSSDDFGLDLPAPKGSGADLPAPATRKPSSDEFGLDLPAPKMGSGGFDLDLPAPATRKPSSDDFGLDLPAPKMGPGGFDLDLPAPKSSSSDLDLDLPAPKGGGTPFDAWAADSPAGGSGMGELDLDLPMPKGQGDLPGPARGNADLPMAVDHGDLPTPGHGGLDLPVASGRLDLPMAASFDLDLPMAAGDGDLPVPSARQSLPALEDDDGMELEDDLALPEPRRRPSLDDGSLSADGLESDLDFSPDGRAGAGSVGFGDVDLGGGDELEFADLPEEGPGALPTRGVSPDVARTSRDRISVAEAAGDQAKPKGRRGLVVFAAFLLLLVAVGAGLKFTPHGLFGTYALERFLPDAGNDATAADVITGAEGRAASDTYLDVRASLTKLAFARRTAGLNRRLLSRSLVHESLYLVRFGGEPAAESRADAIYARLEKRSFIAPGADLAQAAHALRQGRLPVASTFAAAARREGANDPYVDLVAGEIALARGDAAAAAEAFTQGVAHGGAARAQWGLARALLASHDDGAGAAIDQTLTLSPGHLAARVAKANLLLESGHPDEALTFARQAAGAEPVDGQTLDGSSPDRADAFTLVGRIHETAGRRGQAVQAYDSAISVQPFAIAALLGSGRVLFEERRFRDALGRFEAAQQAAAADDVTPGSTRTAVADAKLGAARCMLALERTQDAAQILNALATERPDDVEVLIARGQAEHALEQDDAAEQTFRHAIELSPDSFAGYLALAQLDFARDDADAAATILAQARQHVPETAQVRRMIGESELAREHLPEAAVEFRAALALDAHDTGALFGLAVASRRDGHLAAAEQNLTRLAQEDASYPGLALERGRLFEARGQADRAVASYTRAMAEHPDDVDLMLRLGAAQVAAGQIDDAAAMLRRVLAVRRDSPEAIHFMGRVDYARGHLPQALEHFAHAVQLDPGRGEYHLWLARVALDQNDLGKANEEVGLALERDSSLGDAYWVRGRTRLRAGMVQDALLDLARALELSPGRVDAYADRGDCYDELGDRASAIREYERAIALDASHGRWWYRLGRLRVDAGRQAEARSALVHAVTLGDAETRAPAWLADAHRLTGDLMRGSDRARALAHYRRYLELAPPSAIDRADVQAAVSQLGG